MRYIIAIILLSGCMKAKSTQEDGLYKSWQSHTNPIWNMNLSSASESSSFKITWDIWYGSRCQSDATISLTTPGDKSAGTIVTSNTIALYQDPQGPPCSRFDDTWTFSKSSGVLIMCGAVNSPTSSHAWPWTCIRFNGNLDPNNS